VIEDRNIKKHSKRVFRLAVGSVEAEEWLSYFMTVGNQIAV